MLFRVINVNVIAVRKIATVVKTVVLVGVNVIKIAPAAAKKENLVLVIAISQNVVVTNKNANLKNAKKDVRLKNRFI